MSATDKKQGTLAIVGRPNVGKSAIFNRLAGSRIAIVHDEPGVTRDRISATCRKGAFPFSIMDTGGICSSLDDGFTQQVETEAEIALASAEVILFVVDGQDGVTPLDEAVAALLRKAGAHVVLAINKVDTDQHASVEVDFAGLGFQTSVNVSAAHGRGFTKLLDTLCSHLTDPGEAGEPAPGDDPGDEAHPIKIALIGRPNVGKSSLVNAILDDERTIVSDVAGTTRDAVDIPHMRNGAAYTLIDTAGMRRRSKRDTAVEAFSVMRAEKSVERADICLLVIDASRGVTAMDRTISQSIMKQGKACIVLLNKFDLFHPEGNFKDRMEELTEHVSTELFFVHYAPMVAVSALTGQYLDKIFKTIERVRNASRHTPNTAQITQILRNAVHNTPPPARHGKALNLLYATHAPPERVSLIPTPAYLLFVNDTALVPENYQRFLEANLRKANPCPGLPIRFFLRGREKRGRKSPSKSKSKQASKKPSRTRSRRK